MCENYNINDLVVVKLTDYGVKRYLTWSNQFALEISKTPKADEETTFQIWEFMHIFGPEQYCGNPHMCFVGNVVTFKRMR